MTAAPVAIDLTVPSMPDPHRTDAPHRPIPNGHYWGLGSVDRRWLDRLAEGPAVVTGASDRYTLLGLLRSGHVLRDGDTYALSSTGRALHASRD